MNKHSGVLSLVMANALYPDILQLNGQNPCGFHLPDIPENKRIKARTQKTRKHATKRRRNKLHDKKRCKK